MSVLEKSSKRSLVDLASEFGLEFVPATSLKLPAPQPGPDGAIIEPRRPCIMHSGWLKKHAPSGMFAKWSRRWFELDHNGIVRYYH